MAAQLFLLSSIEKARMRGPFMARTGSPVRQINPLSLSGAPCTTQPTTRKEVAG